MVHESSCPNNVQCTCPNSVRSMFAGQNSEFGRRIYKKNLTQKSGQINKVHWQFFTYPENVR